MPHSFDLARLFSIIEERKKQYQENPDSSEGSYTAFLFSKGANKIERKVHEEALETILESHDGNRDRLIEEMSDLLYHVCVLAAFHDVSHEDMMACLSARHTKQSQSQDT